MIPVLNWCVENWWVFFFLAVFGVFGGIRDFFVDIAYALGGGTKHKRKLKELKLKKQIAEANANVKTVTPGPCVHRNVRPVIGVDDEVKAWLCKSCDTQLPADWAVREEDL